MEKPYIVQKFLSNGYQLTEESLLFFVENESKIQKFLDITKGRLDQSIITLDTINEIFSNKNSELEMKILNTFSRKSKNISIDELTKIFIKRYQKMSDILIKNKQLLNLISINRIKQQEKFSLIVMIKEINSGEKSILVEDLTGTITLHISDSIIGDFRFLVEDEVIGVVCDKYGTYKNNVVRIFQPDIPLTTKIRSSKEEILIIFVSDIHMDNKNFDQYKLEKFIDFLKKQKIKTNVFVIGDVSEKEEDIEKFKKMIPEKISVNFLRGHLKHIKSGNWLPDPSHLDINGVRIFLSHGDKFQKYYEKFRLTPENMILQLLKKRHLFPIFKSNSIIKTEELIIDNIPDIFVIGHYHEPSIMNYKGVTLISLGSFIENPIFWGVNLKTRENIKIDLT